MLTDSSCKNAKCPEGKSKIRLTDSGGLYLEVAPNGSKRWFWKYLFEGKEKRLALGHYMEAGSRKVQVPLKDARQLRDDARKLQRSGVDPAKQRQLDKLERKTQHGDTFEAVAREFHGVKIASLSPKYAASWLDRLEKDLFPWIGALPLPQITAPMLLQALRRVEARGAHETTHKLHQAAGQVLRDTASPPAVVNATRHRIFTAR